jgi:EAL domain-containing protein (putative c-di-GMP-specific phosphodiesterase class I)
MYLSKSEGKGRYRWFLNEMRGEATRRDQLKSELSRAAELGQLQVYYQPVVDLVTGRPVGAEALVRWFHPQRGLVLPGGFLEAARDGGQLREICRLVLADACRQFARWEPRSGSERPFTVGVNLSACQFGDPALVDDVAEAIASAGIPGSGLVLEIPEASIALREAADASLVLERLHSLGVRLAISDFGAGQAPLTALRSLPVDFIKIAKTFTDDLAKDSVLKSGKPHTIEGLIALGRALNLTPLAEGIEHGHQARELARLGCELGQGFYFGRPLPASGIDELLCSAAGDVAVASGQ